MTRKGNKKKVFKNILLVCEVNASLTFQREALKWNSY